MSQAAAQDHKKDDLFSSLKNINPEHLPSEEELVLLEQAARNCIAKIVADNNGSLPDFVVYPETSARVLPYLFNPSFRSIASKVNHKPPQSYFFSVFSQDYFSYSDNDLPNEDKEKRTDLEKVRAEEIITNARLRGFHTDTITVIDDTVMGGGTKSTVMKGFEGKHIRFYSLLGDYIENIRTPDPNIGVSFDLSQPDHYRGVSLFWQNDFEQKSSTVGVIKEVDKKYVSPSQNRSHEAMSSLRKILTVVGERVAEDLYTDGTLENVS